ncbi:ferrous iron transport protein B [Capnocytophaga genosp. AHN8471]|uniref:Ferrous iron transport protein B n=1 Tax=Capnocytophaga genosp. AHN8471 TaxID=327574 RepID=A0ABS1YZ51_9FLAO|nr:ferrous iron transport protein B [Capnocytophaga genosp. AHN8471]MBM0651679.1 ferrous iron transport protein B [Capnocytophaga genosp. AHN8471]MBM0654972.1 ferrous iron transport protein B [Capnocytophaga genosp. AHN8471]MBM0658680.1 ferrous iron transport protein B [Capnocytophaga genosp. AHN8471]MBM0661983.1 ferrous iron transport protein B [Capnocytophaga genosp. AHN8471]
MKNICDTCALNPSASLKPLGEEAGAYHYTIALAGNPNTGKSTVFNALTGLRQHTGNWPGKTVTRAEGSFSFHDQRYRIIDLPGTYSLLSTSEDEEVARDFILFGKPDVTVIVVDASRLERNLSLALQILEITDKAVLCLNLMDEARRHHITIDTRTLSRDLGIPVVATSARTKEGIADLLFAIEEVVSGKFQTKKQTYIDLPKENAEAIAELQSALSELNPELPNTRWLAMRLIEGDESVQKGVMAGTFSAENNPEKQARVLRIADEYHKILGDTYRNDLVEAIYAEATKLINASVSTDFSARSFRIDRAIDRVVTHKIWGFPIMFLLLAGVLWITIIGANYPSQWLSDVFVGWLYPLLKNGANALHFPWWLSGFLIDGVYLATTWVISVMLPPMAIFFPLFTLLEDFGYLPRVAFNLDKLFRTAGAHGKQALTMSMGFGCNAAGVVATRIINSPREKLIAIITNNFSLCNGRWPTQILIATLFIGALVPKQWSGTVAMLAVIGIAVLGIVFSFLTSWLLSKTLLKGESSFFVLELPPYRPPRFFQTLYTSVIDRTLIVLWRAIVFAAPAGAVIWLICNLQIAQQPIALWLIQGLDPIGVFIGLNGVILLAYIVAIPANEIVIPTVLMLTTMVLGQTAVGEGAGVLMEASTSQVGVLLHAGGWTLLTAVNLMLFSLLHNPCSTTIYTIYKETHSKKWTLIATLLPVLYGIVVCFLVARIFG